MPDARQRLARCFSLVFPSLPDEAVAGASTETVSEWDSLAALTLAAVVEEEFEIKIDDLHLAELTSFDAIHRYLLQRDAG